MPIALKPTEKVKIVIDRGGTFTDVIGMTQSRGDCLIKLLSVDPNNYADAPTEGVRRVLEWFTGKTLPRSDVIDTSAIEYLRMGTTVATNALLERKGERCALLITKGHGDCLEIGTQRRPALFDLAIKKPEVLYSKVVEVDERIVPDMPELGEDIVGGVDEGGFLVDGVSGKKMRVLQQINVGQVTADLRSLHQDGFRSVAIVFAHSYIYNGHEKQVEKLARSVGFDHISVSSDLQAMINLYSRGSSATADAYLTPEIRRYLDGFTSGFEEKLQSDACRVSFMQSDGALTDFRSFSGLKAILSGPAGGVVGFARTSYDPRNGAPIVGFDMGGTSTDVSRYSGSLEHVFETTTAGVSIQTPQLDINTVAAGGGSILFYRNGLFHVGPESAGAHPGPACYRKGGPLTVTDANLLLGRLHIDSFPKIFGPTEDMPLDLEVVKEKFRSLTNHINIENGSSLSEAEVANGFINVANSAMARPIRALTEQRGFRTSDHNLSCFGGAGGQHAAALAALLGMSLVIVHKFSSVLSAYGMALADIAVDVSEASVLVYSSDILPDLSERFAVLQAQALDKLLVQGVTEDSVTYERYLSLRFTGSDTNIVVPEPKDGDWATAFVQRHLREFAFVLDATVEIDGIRVRGVSKGDTSFDESASTWVDELNSLPTLADAAPFATSQVYFEDLGNYVNTPLYRLDVLAPGTAISGPAIILDATQTLLIHPHNTARILKDHVIIDVGLGAKKLLDTKVADPIQLSIFGHRFMGIAEQMGRTLQKTSVSLQIKERLDFSCAIFGPDASLVANAPNVPVHLGSMQYAVAYQAEKHKGSLRPGDIIVSNQPEAGGSHLPDITVMQPVFETGTDEIVFWVAARGHHTDIGGLHGSCMHPDIIERDQEGAVFESTFLVRDGIFNESEVIERFKMAGQYPDCLPSRRLDHNLSDLKAQCAACAVGTAQIHALFEEYGKAVVHFYMRAIRDNSELAVRNFLRTRAGQILNAEERMDDGTPLRLEVTINQDDGSAKFDFTGTGEETLGNYNAPESVCRSALTYALRVLIGTDMPLNAGVLAPIEIVIPKGSILSCSEEAPVYLGNGETSQRAVDLIFKAFEACANGHGSMNTSLLVYKKDSWGDSTCGGAAAGPGFDGASAVHVNMTNTRIGDTEILESRFPAILREFSIRRGSGGVGVHTGGCGITRIYEARAPMDVYHAGERRVVEPAGLHGGGPGERGSSFWNKKMKNGMFRIVRTKPAAYVRLKAGEAFIVNTAGGGGYGALTIDNEAITRAPYGPTEGLAEHSIYSHSQPRGNGSLQRDSDIDF
ncbi:Hydantoinase B/oxoprolinase-domain-containing protein [Naematelia encephala]|uniref:Hydantoinase B/oxoprolinase-domain-containing protein n=1 Tax=Naematelia encephala TaxID=71784 RepID=A0A1Y2B2C0_9TREE|nr:Hydantoinase B/oxoprolinase-domain-containing protein [Naematelia encephala]